MINFLTIIMLFFFGGFNNNNLTEQAQTSKSFENNYYPTKTYAIDTKVSQDIGKMGHLKANNYDYSFFLDLKDLNKYSTDNFTFSIKINFIESFIDTNGISYSTKEKLELNFDKPDTKRNLSKEIELTDVLNKQKVKYQKIYIAKLVWNEGYKLSFTITNTNANKPSLDKLILFSSRSISLTTLEITLIPKINSEILINRVLDLEYNPYDLERTTNLINKTLQNDLKKILDAEKIDMTIFYWFYQDMHLSNEEINKLNSINTDLSFELYIKIPFSHNILNDNFLSKLKPIEIKVRFSQTFEIGQVGIPKKIYVDKTLENINKEDILNNLYETKNLFIFNLLSLEKIENNNWKVTSKNEKITGYAYIQIICKEKTEEKEEEDKEISVEPPVSNIEDGDLELINQSTNSEFNNKVSMILFVLAVFQFVLIIVFQFFKKHKKVKVKNDKI